MLSSLLSSFSSAPSPSQAPAPASQAPAPAAPTPASQAPVPTRSTPAHEPLVLQPATRTDLTRLRVKIKSLAAEARIIRQEERRALRLSTEDPDRLPRYRTLRDHRRQDVRTAARAALLAYAFLRGRAYATVESPNTLTSPVLPNSLRSAVLDNVLRFSPPLLGLYRHPKEVRTALQEQLRQEAQRRLTAWVRASK